MGLLRRRRRRMGLRCGTRRSGRLLRGRRRRTSGLDRRLRELCVNWKCPRRRLGRRRRPGRLRADVKSADVKSAVARRSRGLGGRLRPHHWRRVTGRGVPRGRARRRLLRQERKTAIRIERRRVRRPHPRGRAWLRWRPRRQGGALGERWLRCRGRRRRRPQRHRRKVRRDWRELGRDDATSGCSGGSGGSGLRAIARGCAASHAIPVGTAASSAGSSGGRLLRRPRGRTCAASGARPVAIKFAELGRVRVGSQVVSLCHVHEHSPR